MNDNRQSYTNNYLIDFSYAQALIKEYSSAIATEIVPLNQSLNRIISEGINTHNQVPPFNNSAMDGFAVVASDLSNASKDTPVRLPIAGISAAGDPPSTKNTLEPDTASAWKIMTGANVAEYYDSIVPIENVTVESDHVVFTAKPTVGANIRQAGEDFSPATSILTPGQRVGANEIMALASLGVNAVPVFKPLSVALFSTGRELVDDFSKTLEPGQIRNSNKPFILNWLRQFPVDILDKGTNHDDPEKFEEDLKLELSKNTNIIISTGAVSMGDFDFIPALIKKLGGKIIFHKVKIRPGKPILFAQFENGSYFFGLPGNPISTVIGLRFFVTALIQNCLNLCPEKAIPTISQQAYRKKAGFRVFLKAYGQVDLNGHFVTTILEGQESFKIRPLLKANGWAIIPESVDTIDANDLIEFFPSNPR